MKRTIIRIVMTALLLLGCGAPSVLADGIPVPICYPTPCQ